MTLSLPVGRACLVGVLALLLSSCRILADAPSGAYEPQAPAPPAAEEASGPRREAPAKPPDPYEYGIYAFLAAEMALHRGDPRQASLWYGRAAAVSGQSRLYEKAVDSALRADAPDLAWEQARRWREAEPDRAGAFLAQARARLLQGDRGGAASLMAELFRRYGKREELLLSAGERLAHVSGVEPAVEVLRQAARKEGRNPGARLAYGHFLSQLGRRDAAAEQLRRALELRPDWETAVVELAQTREVEKGLRILEKFLGDHPDAIQARRRYAQGLLAASRPREAERVYSELAKERPKDAEVQLGLGLARFHQEDWQAAAEALQEALDLEPGNDAALFHLGRVAEEKGNFDRAKGFYSRVSGGGLVEEARLREAVAAIRTDQLGRALQIIRRMRAYNPTNPEYQRLEARILADMGQLRDAERVATQALEEHPNNVELLYTRAMARERMGDYEGMEADIRRIIELRPEEGRGYNFLGFSLADRGVRLREALDLLQKANRLDPNQGYIVDSLGWVHYRLGHFQKAEELLRRALRLTPGDPEILSHLGEVLAAQDRAQEARRVWRKALEQTDRDSDLARKLRERLGSGDT